MLRETILLSGARPTQNHTGKGGLSCPTNELFFVVRVDDDQRSSRCTFIVFLTFRDDLHIFVGQSSPACYSAVCYQSCHFIFVHIFLPGVVDPSSSRALLLVLGTMYTIFLSDVVYFPSLHHDVLYILMRNIQVFVI